jgi:hypothetical protein
MSSKSQKHFKWFENCNFVKTLCILLQVVVSASPVMCLFWRKLLTKFGKHTTICNHFSLLAATMKCLQFHRKLPALGMCWKANQMGRSFSWFTLSLFYSWSIVVGRFLKSVIHSRNTSSGLLVGSERWAFNWILQFFTCVKIGWILNQIFWLDCRVVVLCIR